METKVLVSNGHNKFILGPAAEEIYKRGLLVGFITAGYPTKIVKSWISRLGLSGNMAAQRLLKREERIPEDMVYPLWLSEVVNQLAMLIKKRYGANRLADSLLNYSFRLYAGNAATIVKKSSAKIYHYRAGYGGESVKEAKRRNMITLCDHSIAHPAVLDYLVSNGGRLPVNNEAVPLSVFWLNVLKDIDQADYVLVNSDFVKETFIHQGWVPNRIYVNYTGIDDEFLKMMPERDFNTISNTPLRLAFAGEFEQRKGCEVLVQAFQRLDDLGLQLEIIGGIATSLRARFNSFFTSPRVSITGFLSRTRLAEHLTNADVFVFPSLAEGSARVIFMALACGCYVITTPNSGSIVKNGIHGVLIPPGDVDALENAIRKIYEDRKSITSVGKNNIDLIRSSYKQSHYGENLFRIYRQLLSDHHN